MNNKHFKEILVAFQWLHHHLQQQAGTIQYSTRQNLLMLQTALNPLYYHHYHLFIYLLFCHHMSHWADGLSPEHVRRTWSICIMNPKPILVNNFFLFYFFHISGVKTKKIASCPKKIKNRVESIASGFGKPGAPAAQHDGRTPSVRRTHL